MRVDVTSKSTASALQPPPKMFCIKLAPINHLLISKRMCKSTRVRLSQDSPRLCSCRTRLLAHAVWNLFDCIWLQTQSNLNYYITLLHYDRALASKTKIKRRLWSEGTMSHELSRLIDGGKSTIINSPFLFYGIGFNSQFTLTLYLLCVLAGLPG